MGRDLTRRYFLQVTAGALAAHSLYSRRAFGLDAAPDALPQVAPAAEPARAVVSLIRGEDRRRAICDALVAIEEQILPGLQQKKYVLIKPNLVSRENPLASSNVAAVNGILDFVLPRFKGPIVIAESAGMSSFEHFGLTKLIPENKPREIQLIDLNAEARYETLAIINGDLHAEPVRLAARLLDPDAYTICSAVLKTHNAAVATLSVKNMALGAPLRSAPGVTPRFNDKRIYHGGVRQIHFDIFLTAQRLRPFWGATVIDGFEGMEGNGPAAGTAVPSRIAIASTDYVAADRIGVEAMGIDASWVGYLTYCGAHGVGEYDLARIEVRGEKLDAVRKKYLLHQDIERMLLWQGPLLEIPPKLG